MKVKYNHLRNQEEVKECVYLAFEQKILRHHRLKGLPRVSAVTICRIFEGKEQVSTGYAFCSESDQFCKKTGRHIAMERAKYRLKQKIKEEHDEYDESKDPYSEYYGNGMYV